MAEQKPPVEPEQVLDLISSAAERYDTVRAAIRYRGDGLVHREIRESIPRTQAGRRAFGISPREAAEAMRRPARHPEPGGPFGCRTRAWHADEFHWRLEADLPGGRVDISGSSGRTRSGVPLPGPQYTGRFWSHRAGPGAREDDPPWYTLATDHYWTFYALRTDEICGISGELSPLGLTVEGPVTWAGREAWRLTGVPGAGWDWGWDPDPLHWGADEYEVLVDTERGVILRCASRLRGEDLDALEIEEIHFDEPLPEGVSTAPEPLPWP